MVNGPRQAGKTTLLRQFQNARGGVFRSLDDPATLQAALADPREFVRTGATPRIIDEVQRGGDKLVLAIKHVVDSDNGHGQFILSGSTRFLTVPTLSESLAGRAVFVDLWPFSMSERVAAPGDFCGRLFTEAFDLAGTTTWGRLDYIDVLCRGGYPEVIDLARPNLRTVWFDGYLSTVILRDVAGFARLHNATAIPRLLAMLAARAGTPVVLSDVAVGLQLNQATVRNYLSYLDTVFLTSRVPPWSSNLTARQVKTAMIYPCDAGLAAHLLQVDPDALAEPGHPSMGILTETFVSAELTRLLAASDTGATMHFYRDRDGREVDFILEKRNGQLVAIEVKSSTTVSDYDFRHLRWLRERLGSRFVAGYVLYLGSEPHRFGDRLTALPLSTMWHHKPIPIRP